MIAVGRRAALPLGDRPPLGVIPPTMLAWCIRRERYGEPLAALRLEEIEAPRAEALGPREVLIYVMAAGVNYNVVWASRGAPLDPLAASARFGRTMDGFIPGSECAGIVWAVGAEVRRVRVGDAVVVHGNRWRPDDPHVVAGRDPCLAPSHHVWGYESNFGALAQFAVAYDEQCIAKPDNLSWAAAGCNTVSGGTAHRMLFRWSENRVREGDPVLVWGGSGGLGCQAIQLCRIVGARPVAVVSSAERARWCLDHGAIGVIDRSRRQVRMDVRRQGEQSMGGGRDLLDAFYEALGERRRPVVVVEHPGRDTMPASLLVVERGGMVVTCGATSGPEVTFDLRYHWVHQKRLQGSHGATTEDVAAVTRLAAEGALDPCLSEVFPFEQAARGHQLMADNEHPPGNMAVLVNARDRDERT